MNVTKAKGFWEFFVFHKRFTVVVLFTAIIMGLFSMIFLPKESNPEVDVPIGVVTVPFPGASAQDVEELVTDIIEDKIINIEGVSEVTSTSREGVASIVVEFNANEDSDERVDELKEKVDEVKIDLPDEAEDPIVNKVRFSDEPIIIFSMSGPLQIAQLKLLAEELKDEIERVPGVSRVGISGGQEREIKVLVRKDALDKHGLNIAQVTAAIASANADIPTGSIETGGSRYTLRLTGRLDDVSDVRRVPITTQGDVPIFVGDVADVVDSFSDRTTIATLSLDGQAPDPAVSLNVFKTSEGNILKVSDGVDRAIEGAKASFLPEEIGFETVIDEADFIRDDLTNLSESGLGTVLIVMLLLLSFLGFRESMLAGLAIPLSFLITFVFLLGIGSTINFLSLFSLILALGILIDSAIVIVEGMNRYIEGGYFAQDAACYTLRFFKWPLIAGTLTTVFAFVPMLLMSGILGEFVKHIPITVTIVLLSSLFVALAIVPTLGATFLGKMRKRERRMRKLPMWLDSISLKYRKSLNTLLSSKGKMRGLGWGLIIAFFVSMSLPGIGVLQVEMFPGEDLDFFLVDFELPIGSTLEQTELASEPIIEELLKDDRIKSFAVTIGSASQFGGIGPGSGIQSHLGNVFVNLDPEREQKSFAIVDYYRSLFNDTLEIEHSVSNLASGPPTGAPVEVRLTGVSLEDLEEGAVLIANELETIPGVVNVDTTVPENTGEFLISVDRAKARIFGVSTIDLARILRNAVSGTTATVIRKGGEEIDVVVKCVLDPNQVKDERTDIVDINDIQSLTIATPQGDVPIAEFTQVELSGGRPSIAHEDGERVMRVVSDVAEGSTAQAIFAQLNERIDSLGLPSGVEVKMGGETEDIDQSFTDMFRAMLLAIFLIAGTLVLQFNSYRQPLFILATIPLSFIGVFWGLLVTGLPVTFPGIIGMVALVGIVVNNAIILIASINDNRKHGFDKKEAVLQAGASRMRPIILTTVTTVLGIMPVTFSSEFWAPLGVSIMFGLAFASLLTLFVVPALYMRFARDTA